MGTINIAIHTIPLTLKGVRLPIFLQTHGSVITSTHLVFSLKLELKEHLRTVGIFPDVIPAIFRIRASLFLASLPVKEKFVLLHGRDIYLIPKGDLH